MFFLSETMEQKLLKQVSANEKLNEKIACLELNLKNEKKKNQESNEIIKHLQNTQGLLIQNKTKTHHFLFCFCFVF